MKFMYDVLVMSMPNTPLISHKMLIFCVNLRPKIVLRCFCKEFHKFGLSAKFTTCLCPIQYYQFLQRHFYKLFSKFRKIFKIQSICEIYYMSTPNIIYKISNFLVNFPPNKNHPYFSTHNFLTSNFSGAKKWDRIPSHILRHRYHTD